MYNSQPHYNTCVVCDSSLGADDYMGPEPPMCPSCRDRLEREEESDAKWDEIMGNGADEGD